MTQAHQRMTLTIEGLGFGGEGYARIEPGRFVSVPHTLPGDVVEIDAGEFRRGRAWGVVRAWHSRSDQHVDPACGHYAACSGCALRHLSLEEEVSWKLAQIKGILTRYGPESCGGLALESVCAGARSGHRSRGRFRVEVDGAGAVRVGLRGTDLDGDIVDIRECPAQSPAFTRLMGLVAQTLDALPEAARGVRDVEIWTGRRGHLILIGADQAARVALRDPMGSLARRADLSLGLRDETGEVEMLKGEAVLPVTHSDTIEVRAAPGSWIHANPGAAEAMLTWVLGQIEGRDHRAALDVCSATGTLTFMLASKLAQVIAVDEDHSAVLAVTEAARAAGLKGVEGRSGRAGKVLRKLCRSPLRPTLALINPMRRPLGVDQLESLPALGVEQIIYLGPSAVSAARDARVLDALGYTPQRAAAVNLHPGTAQVMLAMSWSRRTRWASASQTATGGGDEGLYKNRG